MLNYFQPTTIKFAAIFDLFCEQNRTGFLFSIIVLISLLEVNTGTADEALITVDDSGGAISTIRVGNGGNGAPNDDMKTYQQGHGGPGGLSPGIYFSNSNTNSLTGNTITNLYGSVQNGTCAATVLPGAGKNIIYANATDEAGNTNSMSINVTRKITDSWIKQNTGSSKEDAAHIDYSQTEMKSVVAGKRVEYDFDRKGNRCN